LRIVSGSVFEHANFVAPVPVVQLVLDFDDFSDHSPAHLGPKFGKILHAFLTDLSVYGIAGVDDDGALISSLEQDESLRLGHLVVHIALALQRVAGAEVFYGAVNLHVEGAPGQQEIIYAHWGGEFGVAAGRVALVAVGQLLNLASDGGATEALVLRSSDYARKVMSHIRAKWLDQSTAAFVREAVKRGIPWRRIGPDTCFAKLGYGHLQKTINETVSHHTSSNAVWMSHN
jgi:hypothetical protein